MKEILILYFLFLDSGTAYTQSIIQTQAKISSEACITNKKLFSFVPIDSSFQLCYKPVISNLFSAIKACGYGYRYDSTISDVPLQLLLPNLLNRFSLTFSDHDFLVSFEGENEASSNCIVLTYHFKTEENKQACPADCIHPVKDDQTGMKRKINYRYDSIKGLYSGEMFLSESISIAYYTNDRGFEQSLARCILNCRIRD